MTRYSNAALAGALCAILSSALWTSDSMAQPAAPGPADFGGLWQCRTGCGNGVLIPADKLQMTSEGRRLYAEQKAGVDRGDPKIDTALQCHPVGIPRLAMFGTFEILQSKNALAVVGEWLGPARLIYFTNQHRKDYFPTFMGDAIGQWDGNTLVIDSTNFDTETFLDSSGFPHSDEFHFVERWSLSPDGNTIRSDWTMEDPKIFAGQYKKTVTYQRKNFLDETQRVTENVCQNLESGGAKN
jgi:hypothetical protein